MTRLRTIGKYIMCLVVVSLIVTLIQGFSLVRWIDLSFLIALFAMVASGFYYLKCQNAYHSLGNAMKKFLYAVIELFSNRDYTKQRQAMDDHIGSGVNIVHGSEPFVASAVLLAVDILFAYAIL